jgi:hypothetical protein
MIFQFLLVRLKAGFMPSVQHVVKISIPTGAIKRELVQEEEA